MDEKRIKELADKIVSGGYIFNLPPNYKRAITRFAMARNEAEKLGLDFNELFLEHKKIEQIEKAIERHKENETNFG